MSELKNIFKILDAFCKEEVDFIIIGGVAVILYGMPRVTEDIDVIVKMDEENIKRLRKALRQLFDDDEIKEITLDELNDYSVIRYISPDKEMIDIISTLGEAFDYNKVKFFEMDIDGYKIKLATLDSMIEMKSKTYRDKDNLDLLFLQELKKKLTGK